VKGEIISCKRGREKGGTGAGVCQGALFLVRCFTRVLREFSSGVA